MHLLFHEIFNKLAELPTREERLAWLRLNGTTSFTDFVFGMFSDKIKFDVTVPEKYKPSIYPEGMNYELLENEMKRAYLFVEDHPRRPLGLTKLKQSNILQDILENVNAKEAELFHLWVQKKLNIPSLTLDLASEAYPDLIF